MSNDVVIREETSVGVFNDIGRFEDAQRMSKMLSESTLVPQAYRGNMSNCLVALEISYRINVSPLMVMQNLNIIEGKPAWSSAYITAVINSSGKFSAIKYELVDKGPFDATYTEWVGEKGSRIPQKKTIKLNNLTCRAYATELKTGEVLVGPEVSMKMAVDEGWYGKTGSKWKTMPELMLRYRSAAFFCRVYDPASLLGMRMEDELEETAVKTVLPKAEQQDDPPAKRGRKKKETAEAPSEEPAKPDAEASDDLQDKGIIDADFDDVIPPSPEEEMKESNGPNKPGVPPCVAPADDNDFDEWG